MRRGSWQPGGVIDYKLSGDRMIATAERSGSASIYFGQEDDAEGVRLYLEAEVDLSRFLVERFGGTVTVARFVRPERESREPGRSEVIAEIIRKVVDGAYSVDQATERILRHVRLNTSEDW
jgi:hypothetical protein